MADANVMVEKTPFGVGGVISDTFSVFFSRFGTFFILGLIPALIVAGATYLLLGDLAIGDDDPAAFAELFATPAGLALFFAATLVLPVLGFSISTAMIVRAAYDVKLGRPTNLGAYVGPAIANIIPIVVLTLLITLLASVAMLALIVPGLYVYAMFSAAVPAIVIERAGFGALGRSAALTKNYRWSVLGAFLIMVVIAVLTSSVIQFGVIDTIRNAGVTPALVLLIFAAMNGLLGGVSAVFYSMIYARLRAIKEGAGVDQLAAVFD